MKLSWLLSWLIISPLIMLIILGAIGFYGAAGPHKIYNSTIIVKDTGFEDGDPIIEDTNLSWYAYHVTNSSWKEFLNIKSGDVLDVVINEDVYGSKNIIEMNKR